MDEAIDFSRMQPSAPPDDLWPSIAGELDRRGRHRFVRRLSAVAAALAVVAVVSVFLQVPGPRPGPGGETAAPSQMTLADLRAASAQLESRLADHRRRPVGGLEIESLYWLEAELAWLDEQLMASPNDRQLWRERIELLAELNRRYAEGDWRRDMLLASA